MTLREAVRAVQTAERELARLQAVRDDAIRASDMSLRAIAAETGLSFQRVSQIRKG